MPALAGEQINFIHRDFFDFRHDYLFDEIVTNMPVRGKMTREQLDRLYEKFFRKALTILEKEAVIVMYTGEIGFVKKQLRLHRENDFEKRFHSPDGEKMNLELAYTFDTAAAEAFKEEVQAVFPDNEIVMQPLSLSIACHIGPGALAIACSKKIEA